MKYLLFVVALGFVACQTPRAGHTVAGDPSDIPLTRTSGDPYAECDTAIKTRVVKLANQARADDGLNKLYCDTKLARAAQKHADEMCEHNYVSHTSLDGRTMKDRVDAQNVGYMALGENIAQGQQTPEEAHTGWMGSEHHRENILRETFSRIGVGHAPCGGKQYWVQVFAN